MSMSRSPCTVLASCQELLLATALGEDAPVSAFGDDSRGRGIRFGRSRCCGPAYIEQLPAALVASAYDLTWSGSGGIDRSHGKTRDTVCANARFDGLLKLLARGGGERRADACAEQQQHCEAPSHERVRPNTHQQDAGLHRRSSTRPTFHRARCI